MRQAVNSQQLIAADALLYKNFFANYSLVVSAPGGVILAGSASQKAGSIGIHQRLPLRNYVGAKLSAGDGVELRHFGTYNAYTKQFEDFSLESELAKKLQYLSLRLNQELGKSFRLEVGILNEIPRRTGLNNPGSYAANFATIFLLLSGLVTKDALEKFKQDCSQVPADIYDLITRTVKEFHDQWISPNLSGFGALASFVTTKAPIVYQSNERPVLLPLSRLDHFDENEGSPLDFVVIGTADRNNIDFSLRSYEENPRITELTSTDLLRAGERGISFSDSMVADPHKTITDSYRHSMDLSVVAVMISLSKYYAVSSEKHQRDCFNAMNDAYELANIFGASFLRKKQVSACLKDFFTQKMPDTPYALATSFANNLVLVTTYEHMRSSLEELAQYLVDNLDFEVSYPYVSWLDGAEEEGVRVEQNQDDDLFSSHLPATSLILKRIEAKTATRSVLVVESKEPAKGMADLLFDQDDNRLYIHGQRVGSSDLPTVSATIKLFAPLLNSPQLSVANSDLPALSYFQDRNELQSKIVTPICRLVEKELGKSFGLKITGSLTSFIVTYYPSDISLGVVCRLASNQ